MKLFDHAIVELLSRHIIGRHVDSLVLATYGIVVNVGQLSISCYEHVRIKIEGNLYSCEDFPCAGPWGLLIRQTIKNVSLASPQSIRLDMQSGDFIEIETTESRYESLVIRLPSESEALVMEIY